MRKWQPYTAFLVLVAVLVTGCSGGRGWSGSTGVSDRQIPLADGARGGGMGGGMMSGGMMGGGMMGGGMMGGSRPAGPAADVPPPALPADAVAVDMEQLRFRPAVLTVEAGTTVTFVNRDSFAHRVVQSTVEDLGTRRFGFASPILQTNGQWSFTFTEPGTYAILCDVAGHHLAGMVGEIVVTG